MIIEISNGIDWLAQATGIPVKIQTQLLISAVVIGGAYTLNGFGKSLIDKQVQEIKHAYHWKKPSPIH